ncbi:hypothetical protein SEMRO_1279_G258820.1 [Seminavis robusta]|uniref:Uncharacterized protein n=1 Tax=Seminavis robusta TaxID=568900 RepID=A0A9N8EIF6_9STRA|nr:hypothetical protein SEMRO_1279_G258820.1 [Seminavis robusta]|eukprot:Sro1279_g258820.1 n/a (516) ;mRNA; r:15-1562
MRDLCFRCFGIDFEIDWGTSDDADTFVSAHVFYKKYPSLCDENHPELSDNTDGLSTRNREYTIEDIEEYPPSPPIDLPLTQVPEKHDTVKESGSVDSDDDCIQDEAVLNCYFHVVHAFANKRSYVAKMNDKSFAAPKGTAYRHVSNIASTKTIEQRRAVTALYLQDWRENRGEKKAADHLEQEYCLYPKYNWNYACTGEIGVYPSNCPNESFNRHGIKSIAADCSKNASLSAFLVHTAPRLLEEDANTRSDPCTIEIPRTASMFAVAATGFLKEGVDIVQLGVDEYGRPSSWLCNLKHKVGVPIDKRRIRMINAALDGDERPFKTELAAIGLDLPDCVANAMVRMTNTVCHLQWKQGNIVGDCENCVKHLGYSCPGAIWLRSRHNLLNCSLLTLRKTSANARGDAAKACGRGNTKRMYEGGLPKTSKRRCLSKMLESFDAYLGTLNHQQMTKLVVYFRLFHNNNNGMDPMKGMTTQCLLDTMRLCHRSHSMGAAQLCWLSLVERSLLHLYTLSVQ